MPLIALFAVVPFVEAMILLKIAGAMGIGNTLLLVLTTAVIGATLAKRQGLGILKEIQEKNKAGKMPGTTLIEGLMVLIASLFLLLPGVLSDCIGFALLTPALRKKAIGKATKVYKDKGFAKEPEVEYEILDD